MNEEIVNFAVNSAGNKIAVFSENGLLRVMDVVTSTVLQITKLSNKLFPNDMAFSKDGKYLAIGFASQVVKIFTVETLKETHHYQHAAPVRKVEWNPNPETLQIISSDFSRKIVVFDYIVNKVVAEADGGYTFCVSGDGKKVVGIFDQEIRVYELKGLIYVQGFKTDDYIESVYSFGDMVLFGGEETELYAWRLGS
jgi:WD40 repeat protein